MKSGRKYHEMDGRTSLAHKAEHEVHLSSGALRSITVQPGACGDTTSANAGFALRVRTRPRTAVLASRERGTRRVYENRRRLSCYS
jgi:hypothetical protein